MDKKLWNVKKIIVYAELVLGAMLIFLGIWYFSNGSLELYPTDEQSGKAEIGAICVLGVGLLMEIAGSLILSRQKRSRSDVPIRKENI